MLFVIAVLLCLILITLVWGRDFTAAIIKLSFVLAIFAVAAILIIGLLWFAFYWISEHWEIFVRKLAALGLMTVCMAVIFATLYIKDRGVKKFPWIERIKSGWRIIIISTVLIVILSAVAICASSLGVR
ncbi:MAG: hypothetical protein WDO70_11765 [Alphaproteobacteria bacterium]